MNLCHLFQISTAFIVLPDFINPRSFFADSHVHIHRPLVSENNFLLFLSFFPGFEKHLVTCIELYIPLGCCTG